MGWFFWGVFFFFFLFLPFEMRFHPAPANFWVQTGMWAHCDAQFSTYSAMYQSTM